MNRFHLLTINVIINVVVFEIFQLIVRATKLIKYICARATIQVDKSSLNPIFKSSKTSSIRYQIHLNSNGIENLIWNACT